MNAQKILMLGLLTIISSVSALRPGGGDPDDDEVLALVHVATVPYVVPPPPVADGGMPPRNGSVGLRRQGAVIPVAQPPVGVIPAPE